MHQFGKVGKGGIEGCHHQCLNAPLSGRGLSQDLQGKV